MSVKVRLLGKVFSRHLPPSDGVSVRRERPSSHQIRFANRTPSRAPESRHRFMFTREKMSDKTSGSVKKTPCLHCVWNAIRIGGLLNYCIIIDLDTLVSASLMCLHDTI